MAPRRDPPPSLTTLTRQLSPTAYRAMQRVATAHGPLGRSVPGTASTAKGWRGPVIRRRPSEYQHQTSVGILRCPWCAQWTAETNTTCSACRIPLPASFREVA